METPPAYMPEEYERAQALSHLSIIRTLLLIYGWLILVASCFFGIYLLVAILMITDPASFQTKGEPMPPFGPMLFLFLGIGGTVATWTVGGLCLYGSKCVRLMRKWTFLIVVACLICLNMPLGTALGVYMLVILTRLPVKLLFEPQDQPIVG